MKRFLKSLHSRLTILIFLVALPGLIALIYTSIVERDHAVRSALEQAIKTVDITTTFQTLLVTRTENFLKQLSTFKQVSNPNSAECSEFLAEVIQIKDVYSNIGVPRVDGELLCSAIPLSKPINVADRAYIQKAITTKRFAIGEFQLDRASNVLTINFAYPIIPENSTEMVGLAVAALSLDWWSKHLKQANLPENSVAYIIDHKQTILATFPTDPKLLGLSISEVQQNLKEYQSDSTTIKAFISSEKPLRVYVNKPLLADNESIIIRVGIPFEEKLTVINSRLLKMAVTLLSFIVLIYLVATWGIKKSVLTPLKVLLQSTKDLEKGKDIGNTPQHGSSELVDLQKHFSLMAKARLTAEKHLQDSQESLQESKRKLLEHIENTPLGCITWDKDFTCTNWNKSAERIFGYTPEEALGLHGSNLVMGSELRGEIQSIHQLLLNTTGSRKNTNENITKNENTIICEWHNTPIIDKDGSIIGVTSLVQDVTKNKQLKNELTLAASVFSQAQEGIIITNIKGIIIEVNESFSNITGYSREEIIGKNPNILKSGRQAAEFYQNLWQTINDIGHWSGEVWNKRKNGEVYAQYLNISSVHDDLGQIKNYVAIFSDISEIKDHQNQLEHMAHYDVLTNLPNRTLLTDRLNQALSQSKHNKNQVAIILLDLDGFKEVNDTHGHSVGDELLVIFAARLKDILRDCDTLARYGGDEFVAILSKLDNIEDLHPIVERMLKVASEQITLGTKVLKVSASIGITIYPFDKTNADQLIRHADQAMYVAKQKGKNCYHLFDIETEDAIKQRHTILQNITDALNKRQFVLYYQPKINMITGEIIGAEALIRWQHPSRGLLSPAEFLPFIENHYLTIDIGEWVIEESLKQLTKWQTLGLRLPISINIDALQIQQKDFAERLQQLLATYANVEPDCLQLEILETSELSNVTDVSEMMNSCVKLGVSFAIDDFGTGYSSLTYLRRLPAKLIKIDQTFIRDMLNNSEDKAIVIGIIALAKSFNRTVIAEGVETLAHGTELVALGCELAQGYGIAKPMSANEIPEWTNKWEENIEWQQLRNKST
ncbi:EAL domain-containing protein [Paraglaciecola sp. L3A3]|uniref:EAL domain-containing protein n=1 Tax=Paraglaciecola sp. L3A3 TaxID=2686358 RepID=UPI00131AE121|nr:EAL domain-containing protein [Paraglaciecola sp. L3A3]